jgi:diguanylate cyclase (GGDEF)-like protein/PAS domain S-box-containing protein
MTMRPHKPASVLPSQPLDQDWSTRMLRGTPVLLAYLDAERRFRYANESWRHGFDHDPAALVGRHFIEVIGSDNYRLMAQALDNAYGGHADSCKGDVLGDEQRYAYGHFQPDFDANGEICGIFVSLLAIGQRQAPMLPDSAHYFFDAFQHVSIGMALINLEGRFIRLNAEACRMLGYSEAELLERGIAEVTHPEDLANHTAMMAQLSSGELETYQLEKRSFHKDGHVVHVQLNLSLMRDTAGQPLYFVSQAQDVSQRKAFEEALHHERELAEVTLRSIGDAVITTDPQLRITSLNPIAEAMTGWTGKEAKSRPIEEIFQLFDPQLERPMPNPLRRAIEHNTIVDPGGRALLRHRHGFDTPVEDYSAPIHDHAGNVMGGVLVFHDVSETRSLTLKMIHLTQHDTLTGLPNRSQLHGQIEQVLAAAVQRQQKVALLHIDIDNFKHINELYGQLDGDRVLRTVATQIRQALPGDELLSRYAGDEFMVVLPRMQSVGEAIRLCRKVIAHCEKARVSGMPELALHVSIGVSVYPDDATEPETLLQHAETALVAAKVQDRHGYRFFTASMNERALSRRRIEAALRLALPRHELSLHYQPKVDAASGRIVGAEALLRWHIDGNVLYTPDQFIPVAEDTKLILPIGAWALRQACRQAKLWQRDGRVIPVSVNVSPLQFQHTDFLSCLDDVLGESALDAKLLELELTERMVMSGDATTSLLRRIKQRGVRLSLDDFGTGYCSLSYLKHFPVDALKIDRAFVRDLPNDHDTATITLAIIAMAQSLNKEVIAEGVETVEQGDFLRAAGCTQLQGFLYGRPMTAEAFGRLLDAEPR